MDVFDARLSLREAAQLARKTPSAMLLLIKRKRIPAECRDGEYHIRAVDLEAYLQIENDKKFARVVDNI